MMLRRPVPLLLLLIVSSTSEAQFSSMPASPVSSAQAGQRMGDGMGPFGGSVPSGAPQPEEISLTLNDAISRALSSNLGLQLRREDLRIADGNYWKRRSALLPNVSSHTAETVQQINLQAFGFSGFQGSSPIVGPFSVVDTRATASQSIFDLEAWKRKDAADAAKDSAAFDYQDARETVVWVVTNLYYRAVSQASRVDAARSELQTAEALFRQAQDFKAAGTIAAIELLRAQVEMQAEQQRLIAAENDLERARLELA